MVNNSPVIKKNESQNESLVSFKGYTLDELRYKRALTLLQAQFCKEKLILSVQGLSKNSPFNKPKVSSKFSFFKNSGIIEKIFKSLDFLDYAILGFSMFRSIKSIISKFKKSK